MNNDTNHLLTVPVGLSENELKEMISTNIICRLCANQSDKLIGIYSEDGTNNDLANKINLYLPVKVTETDNLPLQCCWQCASTVLAWHELILTTVEADKRLRSYHFVTERQLQEITSYKGSESILSTNTEESLVNSTVPKETVTLASINEQLLSENLSSQFQENKNKEKERMRKDIIMAKSKVKDGTFNNTISAQKNGSCSEHSDVEADENLYENLYHLECPFCPNLFISECDIRQHIKDAHSDVNEEEILGAKDTENVQSVTSEEPKKKQRIRHGFSVKHLMKRPQQKIDQEFVNKAKVVVDGRVFYKCKECGKSLHSMYTYVWHMRIHTGERPYVCDLCGKQFRVSQGLVRHLKETHERIKNFECDICGRYFSTKRNVEEHRRIHTNERPYICALCGKAFKQKASLFVHNRSHSSEFPFSCDYCPQKFRTKQSLLTHVTRHTGEKPFPCDVCGRHFRIKYELKRHKLVHSEDKPFSCKMCGQTFRQKRYLRNHLKLNHHVANPNELIDL